MMESDSNEPMSDQDYRLTLEKLPMSAQILKLTLLPGGSPASFERTLKETIFPKIQIEDRRVFATYHRLFRADSAGANSASYIWLVFTKLVGPTPETAGEGPVVLCEFP